MRHTLMMVLMMLSLCAGGIACQSKAAPDEAPASDDGAEPMEPSGMEAPAPTPDPLPGRPGERDMGVMMEPTLTVDDGAEELEETMEEAVPEEATPDGQGTPPR